MRLRVALASTLASGPLCTRLALGWTSGLLLGSTLFYQPAVVCRPRLALQDPGEQWPGVP